VRICLASSEHGWWGGIGYETRRLATLLGGTRHEVTLIQAGGDSDAPRPAPSAGVREVFAQPSPELGRVDFACDLHRASAAVLEAIEEAYAGGPGPDYLEVIDYHANGLVPLQARQAGHPLLRDTLIAVRAAATAELLAIHDGTLYQPEMELVAALEREQLRLADRLVWRGGDTLDVYRRYYTDLDLPQAVRIPPPLPRPASPPQPEWRDSSRPLEILFVGKLQRVKGALDLVEACLGLEDEGWRLTMVGADTETAPAGQSVRMTIEAMCGDDPRVSLLEPMPHEQLLEQMTRYDLLAIPSTFEAWGNVAIEAMRAGLPVLTSPVGGPGGYVEHGVSGWHIDGLGPLPIRRALSHLLANRDELERVRASGAVYERFLLTTDPERSLRGYEELLESVPARSPSPMVKAEEPLVTGVVPYHRSHEYIEETVGSLLGQSHRNLEVLIVNDGSFEQGDEILDRLAGDPRVEVVTQLNGGEPAARNLGACLARGEYLAMLDADDVLEEDFVARALAMLCADPSLAYVTSWLRYVMPDGSEPESEALGYAPLGNRVVSADFNESNDSNNWDGGAVALLPHRLFSELGYRYERLAGMQSDWELYRHLREDGRFGAVIPALLARYRVHPDSLSRAYALALHERTWGEARTRRSKRPTRWTAEAADG
jgi:glycogen synthase